MSIMEDPSMLITILGSLLTNLPLLAVWFVGLYFAWRWREASFARYVTIGLTLMIVLLIASHVISIWLPMTLLQQGYSSVELGGIIGGIGFVFTLLNSGAWILILIALFRGRGNKAKRLYEDDNA